MPLGSFDLSVFPAGCSFHPSGAFRSLSSDSLFASQEGQVIECSQVSDIREGSPPKVSFLRSLWCICNDLSNCGFWFQESRLAAELEARGTGALEARTVTVCSGLDLVNITYNNFVAPNEKVAKSWIQTLRKVTHNFKASNVCPMTSLMKQ